MNEELKVLKEVCQKFDAAGIAYMITGSIAANIYAIPRMTRDIDIVIEIKPEEADQLCSLFRNNFYLDKPSILEAIKTRGMFNIIHTEAVFKVDFIIRKDSPYRQLEFQRRRRTQMEGAPLWVVAPEDLILSKLFWAKDSASELQLGDVRNLLRTLKDIDRNYLEKWVDSLGLNAIYAQVKDE